MSQSVRDMVRAIQKRVLSGSVTPDVAVEYLEQLSALAGYTLDEILDADMAYNAVLEQHLAAEDKANHAKVKAETSPEYRRKRESHNLFETIDKMSAALKYRLKGAEIDARLQR